MVDDVVLAFLVEILPFVYIYDEAFLLEELIDWLPAPTSSR